jgi:hypothetical protein
MSDKEVQKKLDQLTKIANELEDEAKRRYGPFGFLFFEADGSFHLMENDAENASPATRQEFIKFTSRGHCRMGAGAW